MMTLTAPRGAFTARALSAVMSSGFNMVSFQPPVIPMRSSTACHRPLDREQKNREGPVQAARGRGPILLGEQLPGSRQGVDGGVVLDD